MATLFLTNQKNGAKIFQRQRWFKKILTELLEKLLKFL
jgi:hypothetical protein